MGANFTSANRAAERVQTAHVTSGFFDMAGVAPRPGAGFEAGANHDTAVISDALWRGYFAGDAAIAGKSLTRLKPGISIEQARADLERVGARHG